MASGRASLYTMPVRGRLPLTAVASGAAGMVLGFMLGGVGPRAELVERANALAELERRLEDAHRTEGSGDGWRAPVPGFDRILRAPRHEPEGTPLPPAEEARAPEHGAGPDGLEDLDGGVARARWRERWRERNPEDRLAAFQRAASLQQVRRVQSRAALVQQAGLSPEEIASFDEVLSEMNAELSGYGEELLLLAMGEEPPAARELLGITHDVTGVLHRAQSRVESLIGPERAVAVDRSALEIWNYVDLAQLEPAARAALERAR